MDKERRKEVAYFNYGQLMIKNNIIERKENGRLTIPLSECCLKSFQYPMLLRTY